MRARHFTVLVAVFFLFGQSAPGQTESGELTDRLIGVWQCTKVLKKGRDVSHFLCWEIRSEGELIYSEPNPKATTYVLQDSDVLVAQKMRYRILTLSPEKLVCYNENYRKEYHFFRAAACDPNFE